MTTKRALFNELFHLGFSATYNGSDWDAADLRWFAATHRCTNGPESRAADIYDVLADMAEEQGR